MPDTASLTTPDGRQLEYLVTGPRTGARCCSTRARRARPSTSARSRAPRRLSGCARSATRGPAMASRASAPVAASATPSTTSQRCSRPSASTTSSRSAGRAAARTLWHARRCCPRAAVPPPCWQALRRTPRAASTSWPAWIRTTSRSSARRSQASPRIDAHLRPQRADLLGVTGASIVEGLDSLLSDVDKARAHGRPRRRARARAAAGARGERRRLARRRPGLHPALGIRRLGHHRSRGRLAGP